jgi:hypothetical protein
MKLLAAAHGQVVETGAPTRFPAGHGLGPGTMVVGYDSPDPATVGRSRTVMCRDCWAVWFDGYGWVDRGI